MAWFRIAPNRWRQLRRFAASAGLALATATVCVMYAPLPARCDIEYNGDISSAEWVPHAHYLTGGLNNNLEDATDVYRFWSTPGTTVTFTCVRTSGDGELDIQIFGPGATSVFTATPVASTHVSGANPGRISFTPPEAATAMYYVCVSLRDGNACGYRVSYYEPNDNISGLPIALGARTNGQVYDGYNELWSNDPHDVYSFTAPPGSTVRARLFKTDSTTSQGDLQLFDASATDVFTSTGRVAVAATAKPSQKVDASADPSTWSTALAETISYRVPLAGGGTYYLDVAGIGPLSYALFVDALDEVGPVTSIEGSPSVGWADGAIPTTWANSNVVFTWTGTDVGGSGYRRTYYLTDAPGASPVQSAGWTVSQEGTHTLQVWSEDFAGNTEVPHVLTVRIDKTPPVVGFVGLYREPGAANFGIVASDKTDPGSGLASVRWRVDSGDWSTSATATASGAGTHTIEAEALDVAGNRSTAATSVVIQAGTRLSLLGPAKAATAGVRFALSGSLVASDGVSVAGASVRLQSKVGTGEWADAADGVRALGADGTCSYSLAIARKTSFRLVLDGDERLASAESSEVIVNVLLKLKPPKVTGKLRANTWITLTGRLSVKAVIPVRLEFARSVKGKLKLVKKAEARSKADGTFSAKVKLARGAYRVRLVALGNEDHEQSASKYIAVRIK